jgi:vacuolar protein sorting-associated protein 53
MHKDCQLMQMRTRLVLAKFTNAIVRSRPLREVGAEQLLIDLQAIKAALLKLPGEDNASTV